MKKMIASNFQSYTNRLSSFYYSNFNVEDSGIDSEVLDSILSLKSPAKEQELVSYLVNLSRREKNKLQPFELSLRSLSAECAATN